ncbi:MAG TPA: TetR/AcrR family transcriptional regulator [Vicinamibacterales bacterium]|nr:TetR/AcrR family transcriptional regulator [Vicinamibacterales bacterium]
MKLSRSARVRGGVLAAAAAILERDGYAGLTMERVAADSGIAKTTVYRRWPTKAALCVDLYLDVAARELRDPDTGDVARDLKAIARTVVSLQTRTVAGPAFVGLLAEAQIAPETRAGVLKDFATKRRELTRRVLQRAIARRQLRPDTDVDLVIDVIGGATTFRLLQGHAPLTKRFTDDLIDLVLNGCDRKGRT